MGSLLEDSLLLVWEEDSHCSLLVFTDIVRHCNSGSSLSLGSQEQADLPLPCVQRPA